MNAVELYEFSLYSTVWRYTSADVGYVVDGTMFAPLPGLSRGAVERSGDASRTEHKVTCPVGVGPAALFATGTPDGVLRLRILRLENGSASVVWQGRVMGCESAGVTATLTCEPVFTTIKAPGLRRMFTASCPHDFCDSLCQPPDVNGNYSEPNRAYADGAVAVFDPGLYFHTGAASQDYPPGQIWDHDPATQGEVLQPGEDSPWTARYKEQFYEDTIEGCVHTFEIYEALFLEDGVPVYGYEAYEYWECPDYEEIYTSYSATEDESGVAHYVQTDPEEAAWDDPAGLPALDDYTGMDSTSSYWGTRRKEQSYQQTVGGFVHDFAVSEILERNFVTGDLSYTYESTETWDDGGYHEVRTYISGAQSPGEPASYSQSLPEELAHDWSDPAGLPALEDATRITYLGSGNYRAGVTYASAREIAVVAVLFHENYSGGSLGIRVQSSADGAAWNEVGIADSPIVADKADWTLLHVQPGAAARPHWALMSPNPFRLNGLLFLTRQEYEDCRVQAVSPAALSAEGEVTVGHPLSLMLDGDETTYGEVTGEGCRLVFDMAEAVNVAALTLLVPEGASADGLYLEYSDDAVSWRLTDCPNSNSPGFSACHDFGAHRWWAVAGTQGLIRLTKVTLHQRGRMVRSDEPRPRTLWKNGSVWELDAVVSAVDGASVTAPGLSAKADGFFDSGLLVSEAGAREILSHAGDSLVLRRALPSLAPGSRISVRAGCDKTKETCNSRDNIPNHGGWPFIPWKNPMSGETIY